MLKYSQVGKVRHKIESSHLLRMVAVEYVYISRNTWLSINISEKTVANSVCLRRLDFCGVTFCMV